MTNKTEKELLRVLDIINRLSQKTANQYIADTQIAEELTLSLQEVRDYIDLLKERDLIKTNKTQRNHSALINAKGRTFLKDPEYFDNEKENMPINFSGNFQDVIINFKSELNQVNQIINAAPNLSGDLKIQFRDLLQQLINELQKAPSEKKDEAEAVLETAKTLTDAVSRDKTNKSLVTISSEGLKKAAENIANVMPTVLIIANQIIDLVKQNL